MHPGDAFTYESLKKLVTENTIEQMYQVLGLDYAGIESPVFGQEATDTSTFAKRFHWKTTPNADDLRRIFNQVNTFYAFENLINETSGISISILKRANELLMYRQGKRLGFRERNVAFGIKKHLPFGDPFRNYKWLLGVHPDHIEEALVAWLEATRRIARNADSALFLSMAFIAIHPFSDGNGRLGRLAFSKLLQDWKLKSCWLNEGLDGELLRTGVGLDSTEYLMGNFMSELGGYRNNLEPGSNSFRDQNAAKETLENILKALEAVAVSPEQLERLESFCSLRAHLRENGHFLRSDPRFLCLRAVIG